MKRDFSESSREELLRLIDEVEGEKISNFTDWVGDGWYAFEKLIGVLDISNYLDDVNIYHRKVIDKNNTSKDTINNIFEKVKLIDKNYGQRLIAFEALMEQFIDLINQFSDNISPNGEEINIEILIMKIKKYQDVENTLINMAVDEVTSEEWKKLSQEEQGILVNGLFSELIKVLPSAEIGKKVEIPLGKDLVFYWSAECEGKNENAFNIKEMLEYQKDKLSNLKVGIGSDGKHEAWEFNTSKGEYELLTKVNNIIIGAEGSEGVVFGAEFAEGYNSYVIKSTIGTKKVSFEESISTEIERVATSSSVGVEEKINNDWKPLKEPIRVTESVAVPNISNEVDWESIAEVAIVIGVAVAAVLVCVFVPPLIPVVATGAVVVFA